MAVGGGKCKSKILLGYLDEYMDTNAGIICTQYSVVIGIWIRCENGSISLEE